ncbi:hypothetical protein ACS0TY_017336 [Phlomoides rotata]
MASMKLDVEKFSGKNDFGLWKVKMRALLVHHGLVGALKPDEEEESSIAREGRSRSWRRLIVLSYCAWETNPLGRSRRCLEDLNVKLEDDDKALMLLNALLKSLENFKDAVLFSRQDQISNDGHSWQGQRVVDCSYDGRATILGEELHLGVGGLT